MMVIRGVVERDDLGVIDVCLGTIGSHVVQDRVEHDKLSHG
jgi:hypothetical protein